MRSYFVIHWVKCVDTATGSVDTSPRFQKTQLPDWDSVSTQPASTLWTPTLTLASSNVDANFSDLHALQSPEFREQASSPIGELSPTIRGFGASSGHLQRLEDSWSIREGFPDFSLVSTSVKNPEDGVIGGFLGLPKESFTATFDPFGVFFIGKYPTHNVPELGVNALTPRSRCASNDLAVHSWNGQRPPPSSSEQNNKLFCPSI
ncbi:hypothetical protein Taro_047584 [Colocasia esculenta]|uniref:Uncharacterized protein n=1 Tax=Colocasia esculenta TaxID=4460 RepID=A0A843X7Y9_COLES|nr:hypothetical protein [Colocasia esculenta]